MSYYYAPTVLPYASTVDVAVARANADLAYATALSPRAYMPYAGATELAIANANAAAASAASVAASRAATDAAVSASVRRAHLASVGYPYYY